MEGISKIFIGTVTADGTIDVEHSGKLTIELENCKDTIKPITAECAMPFGSKGAGLLGPVAPRAKVLVTRVIANELSDVVEYNWFWLGVIPTTSNVRKEKEEVDITDTSDTGTTMKPTNPGAEQAYAHSDVNEKVILKSTVGHKLELSEKVLTLEGEVNHQEDFALLESNAGRLIKLDDGVGPGMDRILITDPNGNKIVVKAGADGDTPGGDSIIIECIGNMNITAKSGAMALNVEKGSTSKITIINDGAGDIDIEAKQGDVYVGAAEGDIKLTAKGNVQIDAEQDINLDANNNVNITAGTQMTLTSPSIDLNPS